MNDKEWYIVRDLEGFTNYTRGLVFNSFGDINTDQENNYIVKSEDQEEFNKILSYDESVVIVKNHLRKQKNRKNKKTRYLLSDDTFIVIFQSLNERMTSNLLNSLVNRGLIETAYDNDSNDFIFWIKEKNTHLEKNDE